MRLVIAEDSGLLRDGLCRLLEDEGHEVAAAVGTGELLVAATERHRPDGVVADVRMPPTHTDEGVRAAIEIRRRWPATAILLLSQYVERTYAAELLGDGNGGVGYLLKDRVANVTEFLDALDRVAAGGTAFDPEVVRQLLQHTRRRDPLARLTDREREVLGLMAEGHTNASIGTTLFLSQSAVEKHVNSIFDKLDLGTTPGYNRRVLAIVRYLADASA